MRSLLLVCLCWAASAQDRLAPISFQYTPTISFGMIGLGIGATARLNVVNLVRTPPPVASAIAQTPCKVELDLYDNQGKLIKQKTVANIAILITSFVIASLFPIHKPSPSFLEVGRNERDAHHAWVLATRDA